MQQKLLGVVLRWMDPSTFADKYDYVDLRPSDSKMRLAEAIRLVHRYGVQVNEVLFVFDEARNLADAELIAQSEAKLGEYLPEDIVDKIDSIASKEERSRNFIIKKILEKYNCEIWLESEIDKGSKFYFTLLKH